MNMKEDIEESGRTAADPRLDLKYFGSHSKVLHQAMDIVYAGGVGDILKRSLFYSDPNIEQRMQKSTAEMKVMFEALEANDEFKLPDPEINALHAVLGLASETGEVLDELVKAIISNREVDKANLTEEAGDIMWYLAMLLRYLGTDFETVCEKNIAKLRARYPDAFTKDQALNRDLDEEKVALGG